MKRFLAFLLALGTFVTAAHAHNGMEHVRGTVTAIAATNITVKAADGTSQTVLLTADTKYWKGTTPEAINDVKVGDRVVVHATKKGAQLVAAEVKTGTGKAQADDMSRMKLGGDRKSPHQ